MNIAFFVINNVIGGGGMVATENAINILKRNHNITIFMEDIIEDNSKHLLSVDGVNFEKVGKIDTYANINIFFKKLKQLDIDIFITHCHYYFNIIKLFGGIKSLGIKVILNEHHYHFIPVYEKRLELYLKRDNYLKYCDLITTIEKTSYLIWKSEGYPTAYLPNTYLINNKYDNLEKKNQIIMAGRFTDFKQIKLGLLAFSLASEQHKDWQLIILGKGPEQKNIIDTIKSSNLSANVKIIPWTSTPGKYFAESSIHLLPSYTEPFGLVIADAKSHKIPTVMFDLKSNELVRDGIDGFKVKFGDINAMAAALTTLMNSSDLRKKMGECASDSLRVNNPTYTIRVWNEIFNFVMGNTPIDKEIYKNHFEITVSKKDIDALIFDYNSLITWKCTKEIGSTPQRKKQNIAIKLYKKIKNYTNKKINSIGRLVFKITQKLFKCNYIILWDSNGVAFMNECLAGKFKLPTKTIIPKTSYFSPIRAYYLARAKVFITNTNTPYSKILLSKKENIPYIINIWHACGYFKKFGVHEDNIGIENHRKKFGKPSYVLCSSNEIQSKYAEIFGVARECVKPLGVPRTDILFDKKERELRERNFYSAYPNLKNKKIYVLAPTWRGDPFKGNTAFYSPNIDFHEVAKNLTDNEVILVKNHQLVIKNLVRQHKKPSIPIVANKILVVDDIDIITLTMICDVFITDFSSAYFEALILNKPVLFYAEDIVTYNSKIGFYDDYASYCPGEICDVSDANIFIGKIRNAHHYVNTHRYKMIKDKFVGSCDGHASQRLINFVNTLNLTDYNSLWKKYINKIQGISSLLIFSKDLSRKFYIINIDGVDKKIHFELLDKNNSHYLCLHFESQEYCTEKTVNFTKTFDQKQYNIHIGKHKIAIEQKISPKNIRKRFIYLFDLSIKFLRSL